MTLSKIQALQFALFPGNAEALESEAIDLRNETIIHLTKELKYHRNNFYGIVTLAAIGAICAANSSHMVFSLTHLTITALYVRHLFSSIDALHTTISKIGDFVNSTDFQSLRI